MLVLLIIFMVAAPLATVDTAVNPPSSNARPQQRPNKPIYLTLKSDLSLAIGDNSVACERLATALDAATNGDEEERFSATLVHTFSRSTTARQEVVRASGS